MATSYRHHRVYLIPLLLIFTVYAEEEIGSPLRIAQCRAYCVHRFALDANSQRTCSQDTDCFMCWENCQLLQANYPVWGGICSAAICFPGCQQACEFHRDISPVQQSVPVIQTRGEEVIFVKNHTAYWPTPSPRTRQQSRGYPLVYVVMRRLPGRMWKQINQTLALSSRIPDDLSAGGAMLRVLVVDREGLLTIYSPVTSESTLRSANEIAKSFGKINISSLFETTSPDRPRNNKTVPSSSELDSVTSADSDQLDRAHQLNESSLTAGTSSSLVYKRTSWNLREISLIHQRVLVIAEIAWDAVPAQIPTSNNVIVNPVEMQQRQQQRPVYYVTWEVDGGGLKGNLFTDSTCVTLTLWPDTVYHIQVELVDHTVASGRAQQSEDFLLDTHRAIAVELDTATPDEYEDDPDHEAQSLNQPSSTSASSSSSTSSPTLSNHLEYSGKIYSIPPSIMKKVSSSAEYSEQYETMFAAGAAFLLFLLVLVVIVYASCRHSDIMSYPPFNTDIFSFKPDKKKLDTHFPKEFMPILTLVTENMSARSTHQSHRPTNVDAALHSTSATCSSFKKPSSTSSNRNDNNSSLINDRHRTSLDSRRTCHGMSRAKMPSQLQTDHNVLPASTSGYVSESTNNCLVLPTV